MVCSATCLLREPDAEVASGPRPAPGEALRGGAGRTHRLAVPLRGRPSRRPGLRPGRGDSTCSPGRCQSERRPGDSSLGRRPRRRPTPSRRARCPQRSSPDPRGGPERHTGLGPELRLAGRDAPVIEPDRGPCARRGVPGLVCAHPARARRPARGAGWATGRARAERSSSLPAARCPLPAARCPLPAARCPLPAARCPLGTPGRGGGVSTAHPTPPALLDREGRSLVIGAATAAVVLVAAGFLLGGWGWSLAVFGAVFLAGAVWFFHGRRRAPSGRGGTREETTGAA